MDKIDQSLQPYVKFDDEYGRIIVSTNYSGNNPDLLRIRDDARLYTVR